MGGLWPIVLRSLRARPGRALLTAAAVALGVAAVLGVQLSLAALDDQAAAVAAQRAGRSQLDVRSVAGPGLSDAQVRVLATLPQVVESGRLQTKRVVAAVNADGRGALVATLVAVADGEAALRPVSLAQGHLPVAGDVSAVAIDAGLADALGRASSLQRPLGVGDDVRLVTITGPDRFRIVGVTVASAAGAAFTRSAVYVSTRLAEGPFGTGLHTELVALRLAPGVEPAVAAGAVRDALGQGAVVTVDPRGGTGRPLDQLRPMLAMLVLLSVVIGAGVTANSVAVGADERRRETGLLRAAGASMRQVFRLFVVEAAVVAAGGALVGIGLGCALGAILVRILAAGDAPLPGISPDGPRILAAVAAGGGAAVLAAVLPALAARRVSPLAALRVAAAPDRERVSTRLLGAVAAVGAAAAVLALAPGAVAASFAAVAILAAVALSLPAVAPAVARGLALLLSPVTLSPRVAAATLARRRNRTALTVAGLAVSVAAATATSALTLGALGAGDRWVDHLFVGDVLVHGAATEPDGVADDLAATQGVTGVSRIRLLAEPVGGTVVGLAVIDPATYASAGALDVVDGDRAAALTAVASPTAGAVLAPQDLVDELGWHPGTRLSIPGPNGVAATLTVAGVVAHSLPSGDGREALIISRAAAERALGDVATGFDDLQVSTDGSSQTRVEDAASRYGMRATPVADIRQAVRDSLSHSIALLSALSWLAVVIALLAVVNTLVANVRQGRRELGLLRAVGISRRRALRLLLAEAGLLAATGAAIGVGAGCLLAIPLVRAAGSSGFDPGFVFPVVVVAVAAAVVIAAAVLAALLPARRVVGASIVTAIRHE